MNNQQHGSRATESLAASSQYRVSNCPIKANGMLEADAPARAQNKRALIADSACGNRSWSGED
jgi:hypothetical protein